MKENTGALILTALFYIGMHSSTKIDDGYLGSGSRLVSSIREFGKENHAREILEMCESREKLFVREKEIVNKKLLANELCLNTAIGGAKL